MTKDIEKVIEWLAVAASHPNNSADDESEIYELMEKLEGCVVLPVEPTDLMINAYRDNSVAPVSTLSVSGYKAMLEAARGGK